MAVSPLPSGRGRPNACPREVFSMTDRGDPRHRLHGPPAAAGERLPLRVVADWDQQLRKATRLCRLIDRHLEFEQRGHRMRSGEKLTPSGPGPEQRVQIVTGVLAASRRA